MQQLSALLIDRQQHNDWAWLTVGATPLATINSGQFVALRCSAPDSYDPLLRQPVFVASTDQQSNTCNILIPRTHPAFSFLAAQPRGATLDMIGPLGHGWTVEPAVRNVALLGAADLAAPLFGLAHTAAKRNISITMLLGTDDHHSAPAPFLLPAAAEYNVTHAAKAADAALSLLDDQLLRWADLLAIALPREHWSAVAQRVRSIRLQWNRNFVQVAILPPLACQVGVCGVCGIETRQSTKLACTDGPVFDLRDLIR